MIASIAINPLWRTAIRNFANTVIGTNAKKYAERGQEDLTLIGNQIQQGRLAEMAAYHHLLGKGYDVSPPDLTIYPSSRKSFDADLVCKKTGVKFHVKSISSENADQFSLSWSFQPEDVLTFAPTEEDMLVLCESRAGYVLIHAIIPAQDVVDCYANPIKRSLVGKKLVLYYDNLPGIELNNTKEIEVW